RSAWITSGQLAIQALAKNNVDAIWVEGQPDERLAELKSFLPVRMAGGGVVLNEFQELLMIKRNGVWDLPKGKWELGETIEDCALREVQEETGIENLVLENKCLVTYHMYVEQAQWILKENHWFSMRASKQTLTPQLEEGIEEAVWVPKEAVSNHLLNTYVSIKNVLHDLGLN
ncbi:MAG: NUDIX domain-containing protein, partial [Chitinophagaceae bacterium]|nr:NUDIX domain-containing protein [Chitinophagaceae bacterium]